jgi:hypothetical protein
MKHPSIVAETAPQGRVVPIDSKATEWPVLTLPARSREQQRQKSINSIGWLSTSIIHDLRNPLTTVFAGAEMLRALGYVGTYKSVGKVLSPWRFGNVAFERSANEGESDLAILPPPPPHLTDPTQRQISPQIAAILLTKPRPELTASQAEIVDALKVGCPGYAAMRRLMMSFRGASETIQTQAIEAEEGTQNRYRAALENAECH